MSDAIDRALERIAAPAGEATDPPAALRDQIARGLRPASRSPRWIRAAFVAAVALAGVVSLAALMPRADLAHQPVARMTAACAAWVAGVGSGLAMLLAPGRYGLGPSPRSRVLWLLGALVAFELVAAWSTVAVQGSVVPAGGLPPRLGLGCMVEGVVPGLALAFGLVRAARRTAVSSPWSAALVVGAASGFVGTLTQQLMCPVATQGHAMTAHLAPVLVCAAVTTLLARRALSA